MRISSRYQYKTSLLQYTSVVILSLLLLNAPKVVLAGAGHDHSGASSFQAGGEATDSVAVDAETAKRLGIKVEPVKNWSLD
jgi:cobalt-zinc-cadmium efflux system membrane fusion protein